jgi:hypothetical protein
MMEQVFNMTTSWTWDIRCGDKLRLVRLRLSMLGMTPIADDHWNNSNHVQLPLLPDFEHQFLIFALFFCSVL